ncbi:MAG: hypothetical protein HRU06_15140 [Oceanospirillaceae bacterium]|nr:hypothetical protein [Oceanospirillaceae bacterium]
MKKLKFSMLACLTLSALSAYSHAMIPTVEPKKNTAISHDSQILISQTAKERKVAPSQSTQPIPNIAIGTLTLKWDKKTKAFKDGEIVLKVKVNLSQGLEAKKILIIKRENGPPLIKIRL